jgi:hypothetical protein
VVRQRRKADFELGREPKKKKRLGGVILPILVSKATNKQRALPRRKEAFAFGLASGSSL